MADVALTAGATAAAPLAYTIPGAQEIIVKCAYASYDGSGAGGNYVPCLRLRAPSGQVLGEWPAGATVTAGDDADASFFPRGGLGGGGSGASGIQFDVDNEGDWLQIGTSRVGLSAVLINSTEQTINMGTNAGLTLADASIQGIRLVQTSSGVIVLSAGGSTNDDDHGVVVQLNSKQLFAVNLDIGFGPTNYFQVGPQGMSFFGATLAAQQPTPSTLADVIAILQAFGLCS